MKFYGIRFGCEHVFVCSPGNDIIGITVFSQYDSDRVMYQFKNLAIKELTTTGALPKVCPEIARVVSLNNAKGWYNSRLINFEIPADKIKLIKPTLQSIFPTQEYMQLN